MVGEVAGLLFGKIEGVNVGIVRIRIAFGHGPQSLSSVAVLLAVRALGGMCQGAASTATEPGPPSLGQADD